MIPALKIHPLMLAAAIAFWGWQTGQWLAAGAAGLLLITSFYATLRWTFTDAQLYRVADFTTVLALVLGGWLWATQGNPRAVILFFEWLPLMLLPVALTHAWGTHERMNMAVLFWSVRRRPLLAESQRPVLFDPWFPYYALWMVAAAAANQRGEWFYIGLAVLVSWPLVRVRPWSYPVGSWGVAFAAALLLGYGLFYGLNKTQSWLEGAVPDWINAAGARTDPYRSTTDIGHIGKLKDSDSIVLRVTTSDNRIPPRLLHRASYNAYVDTSWVARGAAFARITEQTEQSRHWPLVIKPESSGASVTVHDHTNRPNPVLSLPTGTYAVEKLAAIDAQKNALGAVQATIEPGYFSYVALHTGERAYEGAPTVDDTRLSAREREAFTALAEELGLRQLPPAEAVETAVRFFANGYRYATFQKDAPLVGSPIVDFLHRSKSGHCEYFATATVLLLRAGGMPARYATGFAVAEKSELENAWLVRTRHAHAWARAYVNGAWVDVDTTPASWIEVEAEESGWVTKLLDRWAWARFRATQLWRAADSQQVLSVGLLIVLPFALWLAWRLWRGRARVRKNEINQILTESSRIGSDSPFYRVEALLAERGLGRHTHETARDWLARLRRDATLDTTALNEMLELHNRYRFDPQGLRAEQWSQLSQSTAAWLAWQ